MTKTKITPGNWKVRPVCKYDVINEERLIASFDTPSLPEEQCEANARLFSVAPEMLLMLTRINRTVSFAPEFQEQLTDLIKKAQGE